mgnify:FL=1
MDDNTKKTEKRIANKYLICNGLIIVFSILHLIFALVFQSTCKVDDLKVSGYCFGGMYSFSSLITLCTSNISNLSQIKSVSGFTTLAIALPMVILAATASKKKSYFLLINAIIYLIDTILMVPLLVLASKDVYNYKLNACDYSLIVIMHVLFMTFLVFAVFVERKERIKSKSQIDKEDILYMDEGK